MNSRILIIDDEPHMRHLIDFNLRRIQCSSEHAASGAEGLARLTSGGIALVIVDVVLADMDGFTIVKRLRELPGCANLPVIMLTGRGQPDTRERAAEAGVSVFLTKPFSPGELQQHVKTLLAPPPASPQP